jgi:hypothetical protein
MSKEIHVVGVNGLGQKQEVSWKKIFGRDKSALTCKKHFH